MRRRVMGQETEYGASGVAASLSAPQDVISPVLAKAFRHEGERADAQFLPNGSRLYLDHGQHPEYCTGECDTAEAVMHHVLAGDRIMAQRLDEARYAMNPPAQVHLYKNNVCNLAQPNNHLSFGTHENYYIEATGKLEDLVAYLVTRQLVLGAGMVNFCVDGNISTISLSQRSQWVGAEIGADTTKSRPIIQIRQDTHARDQGRRRLHLVLGDNQILPQLIGLKFGSMDVLLAMCEEGRLKSPEMRDPVAAVHKVSREPGISLPVFERSNMTALDIQYFYFEQAIKYVHHDDELMGKRYWIEEWGRHLDRLSKSLDPLNHLGELDWATKAVIVRSHANRTKHPDVDSSANPNALAAAKRRHLEAVELSLHQITGPDTMLKRIVQRYGRHSESEVQRAMHEPCQTTRARARGHMVTMPGITVCNWDVYEIRGEDKRRFLHYPLNSKLPDKVLAFAT